VPFQPYANWLIHDVKYPVTQWLCAVAGLNKSADEVILKAVNTAFVDQQTDIRLAGVDKVQPTGMVIVLISRKPTDENTLENPAKVSLVTHQFRSAAQGFKYTLPADSVAVLRLKIKYLRRESVPFSPAMPCTVSASQKAFGAVLDFPGGILTRFGVRLFSL
jgi:hypothetical protein